MEHETTFVLILKMIFNSSIAESVMCLAMKHKIDIRYNIFKHQQNICHSADNIFKYITYKKMFAYWSYNLIET